MVYDTDPNFPGATYHITMEYGKIIFAESRTLGCQFGQAGIFFVLKHSSMFISNTS